jgi:hypothetical protein
VADLKEKQLELDSNSKHNKWKHIIDVEPISTIAAKKIQPEELEELEEGEHLFHS